MTTATKLKVISADDHVQEDRDLWQTRMPAHLRADAPRMVELPDGSLVWRWAGNEAQFGLDVQAGRKFEDYKMTGVRWEEIRPGTYDPHERLKDMDLDGVDASVLFPNFARAFIGIWLANPDLPSEFTHACIRAYNDAMSDFTAVNPERLIGVGILPTDSVESAVEEMERISRLNGIRGALLSTTAPAGLRWNDPSLEPIWRTASELGMVLHMHIGGGGGGRDRELLERPAPGSIETTIHMVPLTTVEPMALILWSGVFDRYPDLKLVSVESGIGWLAWFKERGDNVYKRHRHWTHSGLKHTPGHYIGRNIFATFEEDIAGVRLRDFIGIDALMWSSDYPHTDTSWPHSRQTIEEHFRDVPEEDRRKIVCENAAHVYGLPAA